MINILTFTPVWQRPEVFKICLKGIRRLMNYDKKRFNIRPFFMVSESWAAEMLLKQKFDFIYVQNDPLGNKKNEGIRYALDNFNFDYILEIGSDDLIADEWLEIAAEHLENKVPQLHLSNVYFIDIRTAETAYWQTEKVLGAGRFISRKSIETVVNRAELWEPTGRRGMDTYSWRQLQRFGIGNMIIDTNDRCLTLDIKSDININQMAAFSPSPRTLDEILINFPEADLIRKQTVDNIAKVVSSQ